MNAFDKASEVEKRGTLAVMELIKAQFPRWRVARTWEATERGKALQTQFGDLFIWTEKEILQVAELKIEQVNRHGNAFLETWSNFLKKPGWMFSCNCDLLIYHFLDHKETFIFEMPKLKEWFHGSGYRRFDQKCQQAYDQKNDTRGVCVPFAVLRDEVGFRYFRDDQPATFPRSAK